MHLLLKKYIKSFQFVLYVFLYPLKLTSNFIIFRYFYMASTSKQLSHEADYSKEILTADPH